MAVIGNASAKNDQRKFFYKISRVDNDVVLSKVDLVFGSEEIALNDPTLESADNQHVFRGTGTDYTYVNVDSSKEIIDTPLGVSQYMIRTDNFDFTVDADGNLIVTVDD